MRSTILLVSAVLCLAAALLAEVAAATVTGVCPDGSMFIAPREELIPCRGAKQVDPSEMPPIKPEYLPRPYAWERFNREQDPNNPYNLIDAAPPTDAPVATRPPRTVEPRVQPAPQARPVAQRPPSRPAPEAGPRLDLGLTRQEVEDLAAIVEVAQRRAPATFSVPDRGVALRLAHSTAFEDRVQDALRARGEAATGPVVLFAAVAIRADAFHGNLTFVQGHAAFHPSPNRPGEMGLLAGALGRLDQGEELLGYAVLPESVDLAEPLDVYWNDRLLRTTLAR